MSRQTVALHKPGKAAAASPPAELPAGTIRQMQARFAERDGRPAPRYAKARATVAVEVVAAVARLPEIFSFTDACALLTQGGITDGRLGQHLSLLVNAGQLERVSKGSHGHPTVYRRLPAFTAAQTVEGPPLTDVEQRYRDFRASIKGEIQIPAETIGDVLEHPSQR